MLAGSRARYCPASVTPGTGGNEPAGCYPLAFEAWFHFHHENRTHRRSWFADANPQQGIDGLHQEKSIRAGNSLPRKDLKLQG